MPERRDPAETLLQKWRRENGLPPEQYVPPRASARPSPHNPRNWPAEHFYALVIAVSLGMIFAVMIAYNLSAHGQTFREWGLPMIPENIGYGAHPLWTDGQLGYAIPWAVFGGGVGAALVYLVKLLRH